MPIGPGGLDSNGIWQFGEDDSEALASDLLNLGMASVSTAIGGLGGAGILQVVSTTKTDVFATTSTSFVNVTGLSATITPRSTSSKILILAQIASGQDAAGIPAFRLSGGNAANYVGDTAGSRTRSVYGFFGDTTNIGQVSVWPGSITYLDSPNTTSSTTYTVQIRTDGGNAFVNRAGSDTDNSARSRGASTITLMEVAG